MLPVQKQYNMLCFCCQPFSAAPQCDYIGNTTFVPLPKVWRLCSCAVDLVSFGSYSCLHTVHTTLYIFCLLLSTTFCEAPGNQLRDTWHLRLTALSMPRYVGFNNLSTASVFVLYCLPHSLSTTFFYFCKIFCCGHYTALGFINSTLYHNKNYSTITACCCQPLSTLFLERHVGFEPTTSTLARLRSTVVFWSATCCPLRLVSHCIYTLYTVVLLLSTCFLLLRDHFLPNPHCETLVTNGRHQLGALFFQLQQGGLVTLGLRELHT